MHMCGVNVLYVHVHVLYTCTQECPSTVFHAVLFCYVVSVFVQK